MVRDDNAEISSLRGASWVAATACGTWSSHGVGRVLPRCAS